MTAAGITRRHEWLGPDGSVLFTHEKKSDGKWRYRHRVPGKGAEECPEHSAKVYRGWCYRKPAAADDLWWNMPAVLKAVESGADILIFAGEKDAEAARAHLEHGGTDPSSFVCTSVHQGENAPLTENQGLAFLGAGGNIFLYPDRDATGIAFAARVAGVLTSASKSPGKRVRVRVLPGELVDENDPINDISDFLDSGGALRDLRTAGSGEIRAAVKAHEDESARESRGAPPSRQRGGDTPPNKGPQLQAFVRALTDAWIAASKDLKPGKMPQRVSGDRMYYPCPLEDHQDKTPSFTVSVGRQGGLVIACSCPGGMDSGKVHTRWVRKVLDSLDLDESSIRPFAIFPRNDDGRGEILTVLHRGRLTWVPELKRWLAWDGDLWAADPALVHAMSRDVVESLALEARRLAAAGDEDGAKSLKSFSVSSGNEPRIKATLSLASQHEGMHRPFAAMDAKVRILPVANGTFDLREDGIVFREPRAADYCSMVIPTDYVPGAKSAVWKGFLDKFVPSRKEQEYLRRLMGYSLLGANPERLLVFLNGPTSTGKTTFLSLIMLTLGRGLSGPFQLSMFRTRRDDAPRPDIRKSIPRRIIVAEEANSEWNLHADTIKQMTSGSKIEARGMRSDEFVERAPAFVPFIATNDYPEVRYADEAVKRRLLAIPFTEQVSKREDDVNFRERFTAHDRGAVLAWMIDGYEDYCTNSLDDRPRRVREATAELRGLLSPIDQFIMSCCVFDKDALTSATRLYHAFRDWWEAEGRRDSDCPTLTKFGRALADRGVEATPQMRGPEGRIVYREGIRLTG